MTGRPLTGKHILAMFVVGFGTIIGVNLTMATAAIRTFPGTEVKNSYVASQSFEARRDAQDALGWTAKATYDNGALAVRLTDKTGDLVPVDVALAVGWPTKTADTVASVKNGEDLAVVMAPGLWRIDVDAIAADGTPFEAQLQLRVRP